MEAAIGHEALFSSDEWHSLSFGDWDSPDPEPCDIDLYLSSGVAAIDGEGCAASSQAAPEENNSHSIGSNRGGFRTHSVLAAASSCGKGSFSDDSVVELLDTRAAISCDQRQQDLEKDKEIQLEFVHEISCRTRTVDDGTTEYVLECDICNEIGTADDYEEADVIAQQHKTMTIELWEAS